jgi:hypothetical protein
MEPCDDELNHSDTGIPWVILVFAFTVGLLLLGAYYG